MSGTSGDGAMPLIISNGIDQIELLETNSLSMILTFIKFHSIEKIFNLSDLQKYSETIRLRKRNNTVPCKSDKGV